MQTFTTVEYALSLSWVIISEDSFITALNTLFIITHFAKKEASWVIISADSHVTVEYTRYNPLCFPFQADFFSRGVKKSTAEKRKKVKNEKEFIGEDDDTDILSGNEDQMVNSDLI